MKIISFAWTTPALLANQKSCTRRNWDDAYARRFKAGDYLAGYNRSPRYKGEQIAIVRLTQTPYKESTALAPGQDWQEEGFDYLSKIGAKVGKLTPMELWSDWHTNPQDLYVVRFGPISLSVFGKQPWTERQHITGASNAVVEVWLLHHRREVLLTDLPGPPGDVILSCNGTVGGTYWDQHAFVGSWDLLPMGWGEAEVEARKWSDKLGYKLVFGVSPMVTDDNGEP